MEAVTVKNNRLHHHGFTPSQWVLGRLPREVCSLTANEEDQENLGVHQGIDDPVDEFTRQLEIRQAAKRARAALLCLYVDPTTSGTSSFHRKGKWFGPGRVIGTSGRANLWVVHAGIPMIVADRQLVKRYWPSNCWNSAHQGREDGETMMICQQRRHCRSLKIWLSQPFKVMMMAMCNRAMWRFQLKQEALNSPTCQALALRTKKKLKLRFNYFQNYLLCLKALMRK